MRPKRIQVGSCAAKEVRRGEEEVSEGVGCCGVDLDEGAFAMARLNPATPATEIVYVIPLSQTRGRLKAISTRLSPLITGRTVVIRTLPDHVGTWQASIEVAILQKPWQPRFGATSIQLTKEIGGTWTIDWIASQGRTGRRREKRSGTRWSDLVSCETLEDPTFR